MKPADLERVRTAVEKEWARREYLARYWSKPSLWAQECIEWEPGESLRDYQAEILDNIVTYKRESVRSLHGVGKSTIAAISVHWFALTRDLVPNKDWKIPTTASGWRQLTKYLWPEIHKWARRIKWDKVLREPYNPRTELLQLSLKLARGEAYALASDDPASMEGAHADHMLYLFDESKAVPAATFDAAEGAFAGQGADAFALAISTPGEPSGRFYAIHARRPGFEDWHTRHITLAEAQKAGKGFTEKEVEQRARQWGTESAVYQNRVLGEFAATAENSVCPLAWVEMAMDAHREWSESGEELVALMRAVGVDVARAGKNETVMALRTQNIITELRAFQGQDTMQTAGHILGILNANPEAVAVVDLPGLGAGPVDRLREQDAAVLAFSPGSKTDAVDATGELGFVNLRSAAWWHLRELLDPQNKVHPPVMLPPDDMLLGDLCAPKWRVNSTGRIEVEPKDNPKDTDVALTRWGTVTQRLGRSPDRGDAVVQAFALDLYYPGGLGTDDDTRGAVPAGVPEDEFGGNFLLGNEGGDGVWP